MKCIKSKDGEIRRVSDVDADNKVKVHGWKFIPKSEWKLNVRGTVNFKQNAPKEKKEKASSEYKEKKSKK